MKNITKLKKGNTYISVCISLAITMLILVFFIQSFILISRKITLDRISYSIAKSVSENGTVNENVLNLVSDYKENTNLDFDFSYEYTTYNDTNYVQYGDEITIILNLDTYILPFKAFPIKLTSTNTVLSKVYVKSDS